MSDISAMRNDIISAIRNNGDAFIANYVLTYCFAGASASVGSVGAVSHKDAIALWALIQPGANFVFLNCDHATQNQLNEIIQGSTDRTQARRITVADLAQDERWATLLDALALCEVGVIGFDASWASKFPGFWRSLIQYLQARRRVAYIRGVFNYRDPESTLAILKSLPAGDNVQILAATKNGSLWICCDAEFCSEVRNEMAHSGLFESVGAGGRPLFISGKYENSEGELFNAAGCLPQAVHNVGVAVCDDLELRCGWHNPETDGCWTDGEEAEFSVRTSSGKLCDGEMHLVANAWLSPLNPVQTVEVATDRAKQRWTSVSLSVDDIVAIVVPFSAADMADGSIDVSIRIGNPGRPSNHGKDDSRVLGLKLRSVRLYPALAQSR